MLLAKQCCAQVVLLAVVPDTSRTRIAEGVYACAVAQQIDADRDLPARAVAWLEARGYSPMAKLVVGEPAPSRCRRQRNQRRPGGRQPSPPDVPFALVVRIDRHLPERPSGMHPWDRTQPRYGRCLQRDPPREGRILRDFARGEADVISPYPPVPSASNVMLNCRPTGERRDKNSGDGTKT